VFPLVIVLGSTVLAGSLIAIAGARCAPYVALGILGLGFTVVVLTKPQLALLVTTISLVNLQTAEVAGDSELTYVSIETLLTVSIIVAGLAKLAMDRVDIRQYRPVVYYAVFLIAVLPTILVSPAPVLFIKLWLRYLSYWVLFLLVAESFHTQRWMEKLIAAILASAAIPVLVGLGQSLGESLGMRTYAGGLRLARIHGLTGGPWAYAYYLLIVTVVGTVFGLYYYRGRARAYWLLVSVGATYCIALSYIRGAWLALTVCLVALGLLWDRRLFVVAAVASVFLLAAAPQSSAVLADLADPTSSAFSRLQLWDYAWETFLRSPLLGHGLRSFGYYYATDYPWGQPGHVMMRPHNELLGFLVDTGVLGTAVFLVVLGSILRTSRQILTSAENQFFKTVALAWLGVFVAMISGALIDNVFSLPSVAVYFWILSGAVLAAQKGAAVPGALLADHEVPSDQPAAERMDPGRNWPDQFVAPIA
jgi:O-antigen ligase